MTTPEAPVRVFVVGAAGMLGTDMVHSAPAWVTLLLPETGRLELRDHALVRRTILAAQPDVVLNCAAYTNVERAEQEEAEAFAVNATAVGVVGSAAVEAGARVVHFSTDYVFSGDAQHPYSESDRTSPLGAYGRSKREGERLLEASGARSLIIRTQWLFGASGRCFPRTMWERACAQSATRVVNDQYGCPTFTVDLADAAWDLVARETTGVVHAANAGSASWHSLAQAVFSAAGVPQLLEPCSSAEYKTVARRPADSRLDCRRLGALLGRPMPPWNDALARFLRGLQAGATPR